VNWRTFLTGAGAGLAAGILLHKTINQNQVISSEKALHIAKTAFKKHGPIQGSWIITEKQPYTKSLLQYEVYKGGISRLVDQKLEQYEFIVDSSTGAILDAYSI
jgi:predicted small secreted protein